MPQISVIMPVHNGAAFIDQAIQSIAQQSHRDFCFTILDDGSSDQTPERLRYWQQQDPRIMLLRSEKQGIAASLNQLIMANDSEYIVRMDADDCALPQRLAAQLSIMRDDPSCGILGAKVRLFGEQQGVWHYRQTSEQTKALALIGNTCLCHPSWMMRRSAIQDLNYSSLYPHMEDMYFLAQYMAQANSKLFAADEVLLEYRVHATSISSTHYLEQVKQRGMILAWTWSQFGIQFNETDPLNFVQNFVEPKANKSQVDKLCIDDLVVRIFPQLIRLNPSCEVELSRRLNALAVNFDIEVVL
ncbi:MAG: glycosyltransferase family 2 protein [Paraglaciecola sp.]|nr:glycosyltransferase family 2 protein [Paraglaciecola sp.]